MIDLLTRSLTSPLAIGLAVLVVLGLAGWGFGLGRILFGAGGAKFRRSVSLADYKDHYIEELTKLIEAKVSGQEVVSPPKSEEPHVINLMDALKRSVAAAKKGGREENGRKPRKEAAAEHRPSKRRRKTG